MNAPDVDVAVIGAGFSGLSAARALVRKGLSVRVLEAAGRVGGRVQTVDGPSDVPVDLGGQWIGADHTRMQALAREFGMTLIPTHLAGRTVVRDGDREVTTLSATTAGIALATARLLLMARTGRGLGGNRSASDWLAQVRPAAARRLFEMYLTLSTCADPEDLPLPEVAEFLGAPGALATLMRSDGGNERWVPSGGAGRLARALADDLGTVVETHQRVTGIERDEQGVTVHAGPEAIRARRVIVAVAPPVAQTITHSPGLPDARERAERETSMGTVYKAIAVYDEPFWRSAGYSGMILAAGDPAVATSDISPPGGPGRLTILVAGRSARALDALDDGARQKAVLASVATSFGRRALSPLSFHEKSWHQDEFVHGGYAAVPRVGQADAMGPEAFRAVGRVHWAATEAASEHDEYMEGAVRAGEHAAAEVLRAL